MLKGIFVLKPTIGFKEDVDRWYRNNHISYRSTLGPHLTLLPPFKLKSEDLRYLRLCLDNTVVDVKKIIWGITGKIDTFTLNGQLETVYLEVSHDHTKVPFFHHDLENQISFLRDELGPVQEELSASKIHFEKEYTVSHITLINHLSERMDHPHFLKTGEFGSFEPQPFYANRVHFCIKRHDDRWENFHNLLLR